MSRQDLRLEELNRAADAETNLDNVENSFFVTQSIINTLSDQIDALTARVKALEDA